jgi:hypothetical protein
LRSRNRRGRSMHRSGESSNGRAKYEENVFTVTISFRATRVVTGRARMVAAEARRGNHSIPGSGRQQRAEKSNDGPRDQNLYSQLVNQSRFSGPWSIRKNQNANSALVLFNLVTDAGKNETQTFKMGYSLPNKTMSAKQRTRIETTRRTVRVPTQR